MDNYSSAMTGSLRALLMASLQRLIQFDQTRACVNFLVFAGFIGTTKTGLITWSPGHFSASRTTLECKRFDLEASLETVKMSQLLPFGTDLLSLQTYR